EGGCAASDEPTRPLAPSPPVRGRPRRPALRPHRSPRATHRPRRGSTRAEPRPPGPRGVARRACSRGRGLSDGGASPACDTRYTRKPGGLPRPLEPFVSGRLTAAHRGRRDSRSGPPRGGGGAPEVVGGWRITG